MRGAHLQAEDLRLGGVRRRPGLGLGARRLQRPQAVLLGAGGGQLGGGLAAQLRHARPVHLRHRQHHHPQRLAHQSANKHVARHKDKGSAASRTPRSSQTGPSCVHVPHLELQPLGAERRLELKVFLLHLCHVTPNTTRTTGYPPPPCDAGPLAAPLMLPSLAWSAPPLLRAALSMSCQWAGWVTRKGCARAALLGGRRTSARALTCAVPSACAASAALDSAATSRATTAFSRRSSARARCLSCSCTTDTHSTRAHAQSKGRDSTHAERSLSTPFLAPEPSQGAVRSSGRWRAVTWGRRREGKACAASVHNGPRTSLPSSAACASPFHARRRSSSRSRRCRCSNATASTSRCTQAHARADTAPHRTHPSHHHRHSSCPHRAIWLPGTRQSCAAGPDGRTCWRRSFSPTSSSRPLSLASRSECSRSSSWRSPVHAHIHTCLGR